MPIQSFSLIIFHMSLFVIRCSSLYSNRIGIASTSRFSFPRRQSIHSAHKTKTTTTALEATSLSSSVGIRSILSEKVQEAMVSLYGDAVRGDDPLLVSAKPEFGDYQCNVAMSLSKKLKKKPRDIASELCASLESKGISEFISGTEIAGPGFINMKISDEYLKRTLSSMHSDTSRLGVGLAKKRQRIVVDFSSPNIAKEMHVGHLRSTIIGDSLSKILSFLGHDVVRINHVGDWGTQFGMLIRYLKEDVSNSENLKSAEAGVGEGVKIGDLVEFYKAAKKRFDEDKLFEENSRNEVVKLQSGDEESLRAWKAICQVSRVEFQKIYDTLSISGLEERGESFYNPMLPGIVAALEKAGLAVDSDGAKCVFCEGFKNSEGEPLPLIVRKTDGGYLYATTDLAAVRQRCDVERAERILYVTDAGQAQHFEMVFQVAERAGFLSAGTELKHVPFGLVQGEDGKKFKSRSGETVKLKDLLDQAVRIAEKDILLRQSAGSDVDSPLSAGTTTTTTTATEAEATEDFDSSVSELSLTEEQRNAARVVGIGAVKYADLSMNRESNYRFSYKKMLSLSGNTAPYMLYAFVRVKGINRKAAEYLAASSSSPSSSSSSLSASVTCQTDGSDLIIVEKEEEALARALVKIGDVLAEIEKDLYPNKLCEYIFDLSQRFNQFYERCPVIKAESPQLAKSRSVLCSLTAETIRLGLDLLGIGTVEKL